MGPTNWCAFVFMNREDDPIYVDAGRGEAPWERLWADRFKGRGVLFTWLKGWSDGPPPVRVLARGLSKKAANELADIERKRLRERGVRLLGDRAVKLAVRPVIWNGELYFPSACEAARHFGVHQRSIHNWVNDIDNEEWHWADEEIF